MFMKSGHKSFIIISCMLQHKLTSSHEISLLICYTSIITHAIISLGSFVYTSETILNGIYNQNKYPLCVCAQVVMGICLLGLFLKNGS